MIRITISSSAALEGAHTKTFVRRRALSPTISGVSGRWNEYVVSVGSVRKCVASGGASRGFSAPRIHGDTALWFFTTVFASALRRGASSRRDKNFFRSVSWPNRAFAEPGDACRIADNRDKTMRVLPVPGGPWMSVMGCFSSAAETARSCDSVDLLAEKKQRRNASSSRRSIVDDGSREKRVKGSEPFRGNVRGGRVQPRATRDSPRNQKKEKNVPRRFALRETTCLLRNHGRS